MFDIVIVGLGPAGSTLARLLGEKYKIFCLDKRELIEKENIYNKMDKCCGGLISEDAQKSLKKLGLNIPNNIIACDKVSKLDVWDFENNLKTRYSKIFYNIDRYKFDKWLIDMIPKNVRIEYNSRFLQVEKQNDDMYKIKYRKGNEIEEITTKYLIGADGANSLVRKSILKSKEDAPKYIAIQNWYKNTSNLDIQVSIIDKEITDFYSWIISKGKYILVGSALKVGQDSHLKFEKLIDKIKEDGFKIDDDTFIKKQGMHIRRPVNPTKDICLGDGNTFLIGEAAGLISPSSAEGYSYAFDSAMALSKGLRQSEYSRNIKKIRLRIWFANNIKSILTYNDFLRKMFIRSGLKV
ncbi:MAG TPA: FAD-binding protein [Clostridiales bacterium]|nr:MAG: hypothetical protein A2Y18_00705 [Clostridiales bacterium GWD2_32_19]HCC07225.1 FAD-binding protein [Clostridiales bacterium]